jgi:hypothetical protein
MCPDDTATAGSWSSVGFVVVLVGQIVHFIKIKLLKEKKN